MDEVALVGSIGIDEGSASKEIISLEILNPRSPLRNRRTPGTLPSWTIVTRDESDSQAAAVSNASTSHPAVHSLGR
jgi:hypothetical protein